jgi:hypothetical protein
MATGDIVFFNESKATMLDGGWEPADVMKVAILDNTTPPTASTVSPSLSDFTQVGTAGTYVSGGTSIGTWGDFITQSGGTVTFDSATNPTWAQDAGNDTDAYWALVYNSTDVSERGLCYVELGGPVDMSVGALTITWNPSGIATLV